MLIVQLRDKSIAERLRQFERANAFMALMPALGSAFVSLDRDNSRKISGVLHNERVGHFHLPVETWHGGFGLGLGSDHQLFALCKAHVM
jgi:hypothetical protein